MAITKTLTQLTIREMADGSLHIRADYTKVESGSGLSGEESMHLHDKLSATMLDQVRKHWEKAKQIIGG